MKAFLYIILFVLSTGLYAQVRKTAAPSFSLKGVVVELETNQPVAKVNVEINGGDYTTTNNAGEFTIPARVGDELIIRSDAFKTVYYTIKDKQRITLKVESAK